MNAFVYMLQCADGSYYVGSARGETLDKRMGEHEAGTLGGYTSLRRPVRLVFAERFEQITDSIAVERQIKGWSRAKKEALIRGDWSLVQALAKRPGPRGKRLGQVESHPIGPEVAQPRPEVPASAGSKDARPGAGASRLSLRLSTSA